MSDFSLWDIYRNLLLALRWTVGLSLIAFIGGGIVGAILLVMRLSHRRWLQTIVVIYVNLFQGTPLLMQLFLTYFGLALFGIDTTPLVAASLCLTLYASAYLTDIWRGSVESISKQQWEASASLALSFGEQLRYVILPQAVRVAIAPTVGFMVQAVKATALASVIGFVELTRSGQIIANATFSPFLVYGSVALLYFILCFPLSLWSRYLEKQVMRGADNHDRH
ncbi:MAG: amino acid ABC transporter permease [Ewingella americana]|jgi:polar amino acid transport system permease protein|uniref:Putative permease component of an ABC superfamily amino acid transporter n=1 Tax=Ewingella americana (strain ATCC 33852 / DSM 4580 / CCUG 14506 / JCM 5911 / LMG 7869 / NCTC 12157 / CDC 1468-78) TaxID=910964 RepID=A0A085G248_EWIA3|nr:amino acid ABC transporter permease [Ewingella americana]KAA8726853.1 amino acid ABC transporter permease [Ewingella americana]KFC77793.1 putative permease component of an ABC superfamily amino acid transporter [Ewingella americana ATCC 33852]MCI1678306.1 amino acid ABC transporter permease [Ewingella americana]MCI1856057.1 amino acid ABC transporter permease [Ewingella americana]MCI1862282.1 amino acid ABC transporter permease [Ewingella americana]